MKKLMLSAPFLLFPRQCLMCFSSYSSSLCPGRSFSLFSKVKPRTTGRCLSIELKSIDKDLKAKSSLCVSFRIYLLIDNTVVGMQHVLFDNF